MKLTKREAQVLDCLVGRKATLKEVAQALSMKAPNLTRLIRRLELFGMVSISKKGRSKEAVLDSGISFGLSTIRKDFSQLKPSDILVGYMPFLLSFAKGKESFRLQDLDLPVATSKRILGKLRRLGLISMPHKGIYKLREEAKQVAGFCRDVLMQAYMAEAKKEIPPLEYMFCSFDSSKELEAVFISGRESAPKHYWPTAFSVAHKYGLQLLQSGKYYYSSIKPNLGDVIMHTLAVEKGTRGVICAAFLALKNKYKVRLLLKKRQAYWLGKDYIHGFVEFIESKGKKEFAGLSNFDELRSLGYGKI